MSKSLRLALCMRNRLIRDSIVQIVQEKHYNSVICADSVQALVKMRFKSCANFIVLYEGYKDAHSLIREDDIAQLGKAFPHLKIVVLVESFQPEQRWRAEKLGVAGVLSQSISRETFVASLNLIVSGEHVFSGAPSPDLDRAAMPVAASEHDREPAFNIGYEKINIPPRRVALQLPVLSTAQAKFPRRGELSQRELEILACLVAGNSNKEIARFCKITEATVKVHLKTILRKTDVSNRTQAAVWALNNVDVNGCLADERHISVG